MSKKITKEIITTGLKRMGLGPGDIILLHSSLSSLGWVEGGARTLVDSFLDVLGDRGTLVVPTFGNLGLIPDEVKNDPRSIQSVHPKASVAAIGAQAESICQDHWKSDKAHEKDTPYTRIADMDGYVCLMGVDEDRNTTLHVVEEMLELPYLKNTKPETFKTPEGQITRSWSFFPGPHRNFIGLDKMLRESSRMLITRIGSSVVRLIKSSDLIKLVLEAGKKDPAFVLCHNPNCRDCVAQRGALRQARFNRETFTIAASASLSGKYIPEIIENLHAAGITWIELDFLQGRSVNNLPDSRLLSAIDELRRGGVDIAALRSYAVTRDNLKLIDVAAECKVSRVVLPISSDANWFARAAHDKGLKASFFNVNMDSRIISDILLEIRKKEVPVGFVFNAANFARTGEKPFLGSYKTKLRRFIDQLDVGDATNDGSPHQLACGHGEIKEMVSILRAASFAGYMTLSVENLHIGTLHDAVQSFEHLLDTI